MGILSDYQAIFEIGKLRKGKQAKLSLSQIVCIITNMSEAKSNLSRKQFDEVYALFKDYRKRTIKMYIDPDEFVDIAVRIIRDFDKLAPYEKYSGRNGEALSLMMRDLREENSDDIENELHAVVDMYSNSNDEYINYIIANSDGVTKDQAKAFVGVLITNEIHGKEEAVRRFKLYVDYLINNDEEKGGWNYELRMTVSYFCGALCANEIISEEECDKLSDYYNRVFDGGYSV